MTAEILNMVFIKTFMASILVILIFGFGCTSIQKDTYNKTLNETSSGRNISFNPDYNDSVTFGIYLTKTNELVLSDKEIEFYNISFSSDGATHQIKLTMDGIKKIKSYQPKEGPLIEGLYQKSFNVKFKNKEKYHGAFWSLASSLIYDGIVIIDPTTVSEQDPYLYIYQNYPAQNTNGHDLRSDSEIIAFFKNSGKLKQTEPAPPSLRDPWSSNCKNGLYATFTTTLPLYNRTNQTLICEPLKLCKTDSDCEYLRIDNLPPRYGQCASGICKVYCGSGIVREC